MTNSIFKPVAVAMILAAPVSHVAGFAPVQPNHSSNRLPNHSSNRLASPTVNVNQGSPTTLYATNFMDRFSRVVKGNINNVLKNFEDPEKVMNQALEDMQRDLTKIRQSYAEVTATQRRLHSQKVQYEAVAQDWYRRAQLALKRSNEGLAREALARREQALEQVRSIQDQIDTQDNSLEQLFRGIQALEGKIMEAKGKKSQLAARARTAKSTQQVNDMLSGLTGKTSMDAFNRMEEKVMALEAAAEVSAEMAQNALLFPPASDDSDRKKTSVEIEFRMLEASDAVDNELEKLKAAMLPEKSSASREIPVTTTGVKTRSGDFVVLN